MAEKTTRVLVSKGSSGLNESDARNQYKVFEENKERVIFEVPEDEAEETARRLNGFVEMSE